MKRVMSVVGGLCVLAAVSGCETASGPARSSGSLAVSSDSQYLYAADTDNGKLFVVDAKSLDTVAQVKVGERPFRVSVGRDDTIYVANRGSRSVSVVSHGDWTVTSEIPTGVDPVGMQVSADGKTLYVVSATATDDTEYGILQAIDTATLSENWRLPVGQEPRGLAIVSADRAIVSLYKAGELVQVDLKNVQVIDSKIDVYTGINRSALESTSTTYYGTEPLTFHPRAMTDLAATPDGTRVFATSMLSREAKIIITPTPTTPYYAEQGPRLAGSVATPAVITLDTSNVHVQPQLDDVSTPAYPSYGSSQAPETGYPQTSYSVSGTSYGTGEPAAVLQGPSVAVVDMSGDWLFMVNRESQNVSIISTNKRNAKPEGSSNDPYAYYSVNEVPSVYSTATIGKGADGIAILGDNKNAYVYNQFDHSVQRLTVGHGTIGVDTPKRLAQDTLTPDEVVGRNMFHDANDRKISALRASVACSSCHLEGRDDGHTWQFPDGPRQTPTLAGRGLAQTAPYHWSGEFGTLNAFLTHTITSRMGGSGLEGTDELRMNTYVNNLPSPENPFAKSQLSEQEQRGANIFLQAQCATCHSGQFLTNNSFADVGTFDSTATNPDISAVRVKGLNVPSLKGLARSAPYLHSGKALTLRDRLTTNPGDAHGKTSNLTSAQIDDLVAYLKTL